MSQSTLNLLQNVSLTDATRQIIDVTPIGTQTITNSNNFLQIVLPNMDAVAVGDDITLNWDMNCGTTGSVIYDSCSPWKNFKVLANGKELFNENEFGHRASLSNLIEISDVIYRDNSYGLLLGSNNFTATNATYTRRVSMRFPKHSFLSQLIPLFGARIEIQLYSNQTIAEFVDAVTTESSYNFSNISLRVPVLHSKTLSDHFKSQPVRVAVDSYEHYRSLAISSGDSTATIPVTISQKNISGIMFVMRNTADVNDADLGLSKYTSANLTNSLSRFQMRINGKLFPDRPIVCDDYTETWEYLLEFARMRKNNKQEASCSLTHSTYTADSDGSFVMCVALDSLTGSSSTINGGADLTRGANQLQLLLSSMTASANTQTDIFCRYSRVCTWVNGMPSLD